MKQARSIMPNHRRLAALAGAALVALLTAPASAQDKRVLAVAEPLHGIGYLPMYIAIHKGYFATEGLDIKVLTTEGGSAHTNAVLTGQAFAFIGGPEHNAFAKAKGAELRAIVNCVDRGNVYYVAKKGLEPTGSDWPAYFKGKAIAVNAFGGTPNSITRYLLAKWKLDPRKDVMLLEMLPSGVPAAVKAGQAQVGVTTEPAMTKAIRQGIWSEPFINIPKELGPYAYSTLNIKADMIEKEPKLVESFVRAMIKGLRFTYDQPGEAAEIARKEFPTMELDDMKATLDRSFADNLWSRDGMITEESWATGKSVVMEAGILKQDVPYAAIIDMRFVRTVNAALRQ
jgi:NitT/TauT family transport system substrate-binding protein